LDQGTWSAVSCQSPVTRTGRTDHLSPTITVHSMITVAVVSAGTRVVDDWELA
jgi:hypothetical protein